MGACCNTPRRRAPTTIRIKSEDSDYDEDDNTTYTPPNLTSVTDYKVGRTLGVGAWADVVQAHNKSNSEESVAIKIMEKNKKNKELYKREIDIFNKLTTKGTSHPNIVPFVGNGEDKRSYYILTGLMTGGDLFDHIISDDDESKITEHAAYPLVVHMLDAIKYCHQHNIVHRDLKPENFVFEDKSSTSNIVLIDFGHSRHVEDNEIIDETIVGTPDYMAPELAATVLDGYRKSGKIISNKVPSPTPLTGKILKASDVWAIGVIAYVMVTGRAPFYGDTKQEVYESICINPVTFPGRDVRYQNVLNLGEHFKDFIRKTLVKKAEKRMTIEEALRHPWVKGVTAVDFALNKEVLPWLKQRHFQSKLKKETARVLAANMTGEPAKKVLSHFERLDEDGDGFLDLEGLTLLFVHMGYADSEAQKEANQLIKEVDKVEEGRIDLEDFKQVYYRKVLSTDNKYIHRVFSVFDRNADGFIDVNDLRSIMAPGGRRKSSASEALLLQSIDSMFDEVDVNRNGKIDFNQFKKAMKDDAKGPRRFSFDTY